MTDWLPEPDHTLSPYTGWTRAHWEAVLARLTYGFVQAADRSGSPARALFPDDRRNLPDSADALEAFARSASAWGAWLRNPANPAVITFAGRPMDIEALMRQGLLDGTDPAKSETYWGPIEHMSQQIVESADLALAVWLSRERVFNRMNAAEQAQVMAWLAQVDGKGTYYDNWILFTAMAQTIRHKLGFPVPLGELDFRLDEINSFYRGDGWYVDGDGSEYELYNAWMFGWHFLLWAWIDGDRRPELRDRVLARGRTFVDGFKYFFGANGAYPAWGRSIVYRFAAVAAFETSHWLKINPDSPGLLRRLASGCLRYFCDRGMFDPEAHFVRQGFHGNFPPAAEAYISPGSPYWACHGLFALTFDRDDPFWTEPERPLPVEQGNFDLALPTPGLAVSGRQSSGQVFLLNSRSGQEADSPGHNYTSKYGKLVYSTHFPFNVLPVRGSYAPDAMPSLLDEAGSLGHRLPVRTGGVAPGMMWTEYNIFSGGELQKVRAAVFLWGDVQLRLTYLLPCLPVRMVEAPGALGGPGAAAITRRSDTAAGWEYAESEGLALAIRRLWGYTGQQISAPFRGYSNLNLAHPYSEQPLVMETESSVAARGFAAASLLRPAPFDPARELGGVAVEENGRGVFTVSLPDGGRLYAALGFEVPAEARIGGYEVSGSGLRLVRISGGNAEQCGLGLTEIAGSVRLARPGVVCLKRLSSSLVEVTTDTGAVLQKEFVGGPVRKVEARGAGDSWTNISAQCPEGSISSEVVLEWSQNTGLALNTFRLAL